MDYLRTLSDALRSLGLLHGDIEKISGQIESATTEYKTQNDKEEPAPVVNAVLHRPQAEIDNEEARATRQETRDTNRLLLEAVAVIVGGIVAIATLGQLILTKEAVKIAAISADAAQKGVNATKQSIESSIANFRLEQRAWLSTRNFLVTKLEPNHPFHLEVEIVNAGKTPAYIFKTEHSATQLSYGPLNIDKLIAAGKIPSQNTPAVIVTPNNVTRLPFDRLPSNSQIEDIKAGKLRVYVYADIFYRDIFNQEHIYKFCNFYTGTLTGWESCDNHNYAD